MRKLASIQKIISINPIEGADKIVRAQVQGWNLVTQKSNDFKPGDLVIYMEIDSLLPQTPEFEFLAKGGVNKNADGSTGYRLKTIRLRGVISQGLILPISLLSHLLPEEFEIVEGAEVTEFLGIKKYEAPIPAELNGKVKGTFPSRIPKTDEIRVQSLQEKLDAIQGTEGYSALKIDGASMTAYIIDGEEGVCSRGLDLLEAEGNSMWKVARQLKLHEKLRNIAHSLNIQNLAVQGEIYGEGIQGNKLKKMGQHFAAFNLYNIDTAEYFDFYEFISQTETNGIPTVPILNANYILHNDIEKYLQEADEIKYESGSPAEGIVYRSKSNERHNGERISFKAISNAFLLKHGE